MKDQIKQIIKKHLGPEDVLLGDISFHYGEWRGLVVNKCGTLLVTGWKIKIENLNDPPEKKMKP